jgi:DNA-binding PadR family transcriptional regulator
MVPEAVTQMGIASGIGINYSHVPRAVKRLQFEDHVTEVLAHVDTQPTGRRRKAYKLTDIGLNVARKLHSALAKSVIIFISNSGKTMEIPLEKVNELLETNEEIIKLYSEINSDGVFSQTEWETKLKDLKKQSKVKITGSRITDIYGSPIIMKKDQIAEPKLKQDILLNRSQYPYTDGFINREKSMKLLNDALHSKDVGMIIISGSNGIGRSTLVGNSLFESDNKKFNTHWYNLSGFSSVDHILDSLYRSIFNKEMMISKGSENEIISSLNDEFEHSLEQFKTPIDEILKKLSTKESILILDDLKYLESISTDPESSISEAFSDELNDEKTSRTNSQFVEFITLFFERLYYTTNAGQALKIIIISDDPISEDHFTKIQGNDKKLRCVQIQLEELELNYVKKLLSEDFKDSEIAEIYNHIGGNPLKVKTLAEIYNYKRDELDGLTSEERALSLSLMLEHVLENVSQ